MKMNDELDFYWTEEYEEDMDRDQGIYYPAVLLDETSGLGFSTDTVESGDIN